MICPTCSGKGRIFPWMRKKLPPYLKCFRCNGVGEVPNETRLRMKEGRVLRNARINKRLTLRKASKMLNINVTELLDMENGAIQPDFSILAEYDAC